MIKRNEAIIIILILVSLTSIKSEGIVRGEENLASRLNGRILLQVESDGEAWYVGPETQHRISLNSPQNAFETIKQTGQGITNQNLSRIPIGILNENNARDSDNDGLPDDLERALGTDSDSADTDNDGYDDITEIKNNYNPTGEGRLEIDQDFTNKHLGRIFLQVERNGNAWYVDPVSKKRYYLSRPVDTLQIMRDLGLGITNKDLERIPIQNSGIPKEKNEKNTKQGSYSTSTSPSITADTAQQAISGITTAINNGEIANAKEYVVPDLQSSLEYSLERLDASGRATFSDILSGARLSESDSSDTEKTYIKNLYFSLGGYETEYSFTIKKQPDDSWLISSM